MSQIRIVFSLLVICLLPVSHQYTIAVQGRLDIGEHISGFLKDIYSRLLSSQDSVDTTDQANRLSDSGNAMRHMKNPMMHVFGSHVGKREGVKPVNNINVK